MRIVQRFSMLMKGQLNGVLDQLEDPEKSIHQLILDMGEHLEEAKKAAARAIANEDQLRSRIVACRQDAEEWENASRRAMKQGAEQEARDALRRAARGQQQAENLAAQLTAQETDTQQIEDTVRRLHERLEEARGRQHRLQARRRQGEARRAIGQAMQGIERADFGNELDRLGERIEVEIAEENAYFALDDRLSGRDVRRRRDESALEETVEERLAALRKELTPKVRTPKTRKKKRKS